ncbi:MAG: thiolase family protein [Candidatus Omnitrophota bacterium]|nr:thiolase family protein [Candidatus Omnitrophota bacterium]
MKKIAIVDGVRTPFVKAWTHFDRLPAQRLGAMCVTELLQRTDFNPENVDEVIMGCVGQPIDAANVARVISLYAGIPKDKKAYTVNRNCASGFEALTSAAEKIRAGVDEIVIAGGAESMSNAPFTFTKEMSTLLLKLSRAKTLSQKLGIVAGMRPRHFKPVAALQLALTDPVCGLNMGETAEVVAKKFGVLRARQDEFAVQSHKKAVMARGLLREEIMTVHISPKYGKYVQDDNGPRENQSIEALAKLRTIFDRRSGTVTAGNASQITDGACALLVMDEAKAKAMGYEILGTLREYEYVGLEPSEMGMGPAFAIEKVLRKSGLSLKEIDLFEINEAFAAQVLASVEALASKKFAEENFSGRAPVGEIDPERLNVNGGGIALGHPVGVTGARLVLTCLKELKRRSLKRGLVSLCVGGGQGSALILERN